MKIIELLNKISRGEEVPKVIKKYWKYEWQYDETREEYTYIQETGERFDDDWLLIHMLNDEIEIIEKDKKIEPIKFNKDGDIEYCDFFGIHHFNTNKRTRFMADKINEIIDVINKGDK